MKKITEISVIFGFNPNMTLQIASILTIANQKWVFGYEVPPVRMSNFRKNVVFLLRVAESFEAKNRFFSYWQHKQAKVYATLDW